MGLQQKTKTVGGGAAGPLGEDFVNFLRMGLGTGGDFGSAGKQYGQNTAGDALSRSNPIGHTQGVAGGIERFLGGDFGRQSYSLNPTMVDFSKVGDVYGGLNANPLFKSSGSSGLTPGLDAASNYLSRQSSRNAADLAARFSYAGGGGFGSGASQALGSYMADADASNANALAGIARDDSNIKLAALQALANQNMGWAGLGMQNAGLNEQGRQFDVGQQGNFLQNLLQLYAGLGSKGIPQAQTVAQDNWLQQALKIGTGLTDIGTKLAGIF